MVLENRKGVMVQQTGGNGLEKGETNARPEVWLCKGKYTLSVELGGVVRSDLQGKWREPGTYKKRKIRGSFDLDRGG